MRAKINRGTLTTESEGNINQRLGQNLSVDFFNDRIYRKSSNTICNQVQKFEKIMVEMNRQALNLQLSKQKNMEIRPGCTLCKIRRDYPFSQESQIHFYSECLYTQRFWTEIKGLGTAPTKR